MFDNVLIDKEKDLKDFVVAVMVYTVVFVLVAVVLTRTVLPFKVDGMNYGGLIAVFLTTMALSYPLTNYMRQRDSEELRRNMGEGNILKRHFSELQVYIGCFLAATLAFGIASFLFRDSFSLQITMIEGIRGSITGSIAFPSNFVSILFNNVLVFLATFGISFFISGGMVFILLWNASVLGVLIGVVSENLLHLPLNLLPYIFHGTVEIGAYVFAGFAGTLLAYHFEHYWVHNTHDRSSFRKVGEDVLLLIMIGLFSLFVAAMAETGFPFTVL